MSAVDNDQIRRRPGATVEPALPLSLLEAIKAYDLPSEFLEDEDLTTSLPRRLGLTGVVEKQIQRYLQEYRRRRPVSVDEVANLLRLVLRRPDAEQILRDTGHRVARRAFERRASAVTGLLRALPGRIGFAAARRAALRVMRRVAGGSRVELAGKPLVARISDSFTAEADPNGTACALYAGIVEETLVLYNHPRPDVLHSRCSARGDFCCEWKLTD